MRHEELPPGTHAAFAALRARFRAGLAERWTAIRCAPTAAAQEAALHRLAGAAGAFDHPQLGEAARAALHACGGDDAALQAALRALEQVVEHTLRAADTFS